MSGPDLQALCDQAIEDAASEIANSGGIITFMDAAVGAEVASALVRCGWRPAALRTDTPAPAQETADRQATVQAADVAHYARLLLRLRDRLVLITDGLDDEGDRVYLGSTNDADDLREIMQSLDDVRWDRATRDAELPDLYADLRALRGTEAALRAQVEGLAEACGHWLARHSQAESAEDLAREHPCDVVEAILLTRAALTAAGRRTDG